MPYYDIVLNLAFDKLLTYFFQKKLQPGIRVIVKVKNATQRC